MKQLLRISQALYSVYAILIFVLLLLAVFPFVLLASPFGKIKGGNIIYRICSIWSDIWFFLIGIWAKKIIDDITGLNNGPVTVYEDNQAAIAIVNGGHSSRSRTKHYDVKVRYLQEVFEGDDSLFQLIYCPTDRMLADFLTKSLTPIVFKTLTDIVMCGSVVISPPRGDLSKHDKSVTSESPAQKRLVGIASQP